MRHAKDPKGPMLFWQGNYTCSPYQQNHGMDFVRSFPESKGYDYLWVVICWMMSMIHLISVTTRNSQQQGLEVHLQMVEGTSLPDRCQTIDVRIIPSPNRWSVGTSNKEHNPDTEDSGQIRPNGLD